jgi:hypothetical protein
MKLPYFPVRGKIEKLSPQNEKVFAEASELALLRLEQCIADLKTWVPAVNDSVAPTRLRPARKFPN